MTALLATGVIATAPLPVIVAILAGVSLGVSGFAMWLGRGSTLPAAMIGAAILVYFLVDAAFGFPSMLTTFLGSQGFDGGRYYGIHNVDIGLLLGAACFVAAVLRPTAGFVLMVLTGIVLSFPSFGANHGGGGTLFFAAGLWLALEGTWNPMTWRRWAIAITITLLGVALIFLADAVAKSPTHGTRFLEQEGAAGFLPRLWERLGIGFRLLARNPAGILYLALTPVLLLFTIRPRGRLRATLEAEPRWRAAIAVILGASILSFFINDTGVAAVALGFATAASGLVFVSLMQPVRPVGLPGATAPDGGSR
jgi:hypothetical protein